MNHEIHYIGLDVHADSISIAIAEAGRDGDVRFYGKIPNELHMVDKVLKKLHYPAPTRPRPYNVKRYSVGR
jgi:transposase